MSNKVISILGSGWLGLPLAEYFVSLGHAVKASTTTKHRLETLSALHIEPYLVDIGQLGANIQSFLQANILIINITSKNTDDFINLIKVIEISAIEQVIFISSTSVYANLNKTVTEDDIDALVESPLLSIENLFRESVKFKTTIVRFAGLIGYRRNPGNFFKSGRTVDQPDANVNLIHRDDCIEIINQIIVQGIWGEVFNGCADSHPTKKEYYTQAAINCGNSVPVFNNTMAKSFKIICNQKLKRMLNYQFLHPDLIKITFDNND